MSLNGILQTATSGLNAAQAALNAISDNIANVNTPGYTRKTITQQQQIVAGAGMGVDVTGVHALRLRRHISGHERRWSLRSGRH